MSLIELKNVRKFYESEGENVAALQELTASVESGDFVAIMGPSGSGKSTLLNILGGLSHPSAGNYIVDGIDIYGLPNEKLADFRREYIGFVFQSFQLIPYLTVLENVMLPLTIIRGSNGWQKEAACQVLEKVGLGAKERRLPNQLSGGEQERVAIARALVNHPPIILADEPTGNLDSATGDEIMALLGDLNAEGQTIIMVTHNPENAASAREVIRLKDGKIQG
ncbi:MAG: ABC transporter ATP-binding protein [Syntrophales bacterium]|jgi:putative ABC transport system ATP-binding protein|nr:ABC transporter ATP-binding protein [Syntrophales bacterium]